MVDDPAEVLNRYAIELAAMAQNGLHYADSPYDTKRLHRTREIAAGMLELLSDADPAELRGALTADLGHATPKVDVRGALFEADRVLLVREARDGTWSLPGGWADPLDTPSEAAEREFAEEAGLRVRVAKLAAVHDGTRHNGHRVARPWHIYKLLFIVDRLDDAAPVAGLDGETSAVGFFPLDALPTLSTARNTEAQLRLLYEHQLRRDLPAAVD